MTSLLDLNDLKSAVVNTVAGGTVAVIAAVANQTIRVYRLSLFTAASTTLILKNDVTALTGPMTLTELRMDALIVGPRLVPLYTCTVGKAFNITFGGAVQCSGTIWYTQD